MSAVVLACVLAVVISVIALCFASFVVEPLVIRRDARRRAEYTQKRREVELPQWLERRK